MTQEEYTKTLENVIKQMLTPLKGIPLGLVIEHMSGYKILPFDNSNPNDVELLSNLVKVASEAGRRFNDKNVKRKRPNEIGNDIEPFVKDALIELGYKAYTPKTSKGKMKSTGYPDIEFTDSLDRVNYIECKTFNIENIATTQRSFYLSPSESFKITSDAHHFILSFEIFVDGNVENMNIYRCKSWKILSMENLDVDVKYEFNSDNARMYNNKLILSEGNIN